MSSKLTSPRTHRGTAWLVSLGLGALVLTTAGASRTTTKVAENQYIGATRCKTCHSSEQVGDQYGIWEHSKHAMAFETLASDQAKAIAKEKGIDDPQKADACVKCHTTAFGVDASMIKKGFKPEMGVQCETCHGPGADHMKARLMNASSDDPAKKKAQPGEIIASPPAETCRQCHNHESPTYKPFCYYERVAKIRHLMPKTPEEMAKVLVCGCGDHCTCDEKCADGCGVPQGSLKK